MILQALERYDSLANEIWQIRDFLDQSQSVAFHLKNSNRAIKSEQLVNVPTVVASPEVDPPIRRAEWIVTRWWGAGCCHSFQQLYFAVLERKSR